MGIIQVGDIVARKSYSYDIYFKVTEIYKEGSRTLALLKGLDIRLCADAPVEDLERVSPEKIRSFRQELVKLNQKCLGEVFQRREEERKELVRLCPQGEECEGGELPFFEIPGRVLHLDGDEEYLEICLSTYKQLGVKVAGYCIEEKEQPLHVRGLLEEYKPDILVITGHDGLLRGRSDFRSLENYRHSPSFVETVKIARRYEPSLDDLIIFAGACQSHYEAILEAGANFASSPRRVLIHCLDPVLISEKVAYTPSSQNLPLKEILKSTITGLEGVGGVETRGKYRMGFPKSPY